MAINEKRKKVSSILNYEPKYVEKSEFCDFNITFNSECVKVGADMERGATCLTKGR